jgi:hypothetical protein
MRRWFPLVLVLALSCAATATDIYNNLNSVTNGSPDSVSGAGPLADSFSTGNAGFTLVGVGLKLVDLGEPTGSFTIQLLSDNNIFPGSPIYTIATVSDGDLTGTLQNYFFDLATPQALDPNTRYWIELSSSDGSQAGWSWSDDQSAVGVTGEYFFNHGIVIPNSNGPYQMELSDQALVPEPGTFLMFGTAVAGGLAALRRKLLG